MFNINEELKKSIHEINANLSSRFDSIPIGDKSKFRDFIMEKVGVIFNVGKLSIDELADLSREGGIVAVDGSTNRVGGAYPHYIEIFQSLAKSTKITDEPIYKTEVYTPILNDEVSSLEIEEDVHLDKRDSKLATIEVEVAIESVEKQKPSVIMMDGGFIRYQIYCKDRWNVLRHLCEENNILLIGVIKDIKTSIIGDVIRRDDSTVLKVYDRELLFGILDYGEVISIKETVNKKHLESGIDSAFIRSSLSPKVIGLDIIDSQKKHLEMACKLIICLTPENSRGIPIWLDIVDKEVKISDAMMKGLLRRYLDRGIYERFFVPERDKRN